MSEKCQFDVPRQDQLQGSRGDRHPGLGAPRRGLRWFLTGAIAAGLLLAGAQAPVAANECKGLEQNACAANAACLWVDPYERKDGVKVKGYCRVKSPTKKPAADSQ